jgi:hypothetical protein
VATAPRGFRDALVTDGQGETRLPLNVDVGVPFRRLVKLKVESHSSLPRQVTATLLAPFRDEQGLNVRPIDMALAEGHDATQTAQPGEAVTFAFCLAVSDEEDLRSGSARLRFSSPGVHGVEFPVDVKIREPLIGSWIRALAYLLCLLLVPLILLALRSMVHARRSATEQPFVCRPGRPSKQLAVERAAKGQARLITDGPVTVKRQDDSRARQVNGQLKISADDASPSNPLLINEQRPDGERSVIAVTDVLTNEDGEPEVHGYVVDGGRFDRQVESSKKTALRRALMAAAMLVVGFFLFHGPVLAAAQWVCDFAPF